MSAFVLRRRTSGCPRLDVKQAQRMREIKTNKGSDMNKVASALMTFIALASCNALSFQSELTFSGEEEDFMHTRQVAFTRYIEPVELQSTPWAEAAFVARASRIGGKIFESSSFAYKENGYALFAREHFLDNYFAGGEVRVIDNTEHVSLDIGYYATQNSAVYLRYGKEGDSSLFSIGTKNILDFAGDRFLNLEAIATTVYDQDTTLIAVRADYYFTSRTGLGLSGETSAEGSYEEYGVNFNHFLSKNAGIEVSYSGRREGTTQVALNVRF